MNRRHKALAASLALAFPALWISSCNVGQGGGSSAAGGTKGFDVQEITHGFGLLVPHQTFRLDASGNATPEIIPLREIDDIVANVTPANPILPPTTWPTSAILPDGSPGNQYLAVRFNRPLDITSVLDQTPSGQLNSGLKGTLVVLAFDPGTNTSIPVKGRAFVGGRTFAGAATGTPPVLSEQQWVKLDPDTGNLVPTSIDNDGDGTPDGLGFPGTENGPFAGAAQLVANNEFVFVVDSDGDLRTHETFPTGRQIKISVGTSVRDTNGKFLSRSALGSTTVGPDTLLPELASTPPPNSVPLVTPGGGDTDVDPTTTIRMVFTEPIQPTTLGPLPNGQPAGVTSYLTLQFGPPSQQTTVPYLVQPVSALDLTVWDVIPGFQFPGQGPAGLPCGTFNEVRIATATGQLQDLNANLNQLAAQTNFFTGAGPGLINAPVAPDVIYATRLGAEPSVSVIDLNGFGQSTGDPTFDFVGGTFPAGNSNFPNNPNVFLQGGVLRPQLAPGTCTIDGGSAGVFTLTKDSNLDDRLLRPPVVTQTGEIMLGWSLDNTFNAGQEVTGCQAGGGNLCAITGMKLLSVSQNTTNSVAPTLFANPTNLIVALMPGGPNPISFAPHPNPPALTFPPLCQVPFIPSTEPTSIDNTLATNGVTLAQNLLVPGDPFGDPNNGIPPSGLLTQLQNAFFQGPSVPGIPLAACQQYQVRQQIGHFLYMLDRARREVVVLNSNRFTVLDRIPVSDPTEMAMGPNLDFLAITNQSSDTVSFIDIKPGSSTFHKVVKNTKVGRAPRGIAWDPGNEDLLVCNESDNSLSVISVLNLDVRKTVSNTLVSPFDVVITQRQTTFGFQRLVYYGWILNRNGQVSLFESGPSGPNGWGFDDVVGTVPFTFTNPRKIAVDHLNLNGSVWIVHENPLNLDGSPTGQTGGAITNLFIESANFGPQLLNLQIFANILSLRDLGFAIRASIGQGTLTGVPVDIAFDNLINVASMANPTTQFSAGFPLQMNGKAGVKFPGAAVGVNQPRFMFAAIPASSEGPGVVDVISLDSGNPRVDVDVRTPGVQSIQVQGVTQLSDYFRQ